ncbi:MAG TPA: MerR family transcriptional regulator [Vicinamibacteria bacterium]|nr:MerR family transcriptional regulator [Vicinamibacteria bacterium]
MEKKIPSKLFFKIGEVCELTDTQPYVLRYWESEFTALAPAKNNSGQRIYRRRDIETILRIKELLYEEGFTIAGAKKKLEQEMKDPTSKGAPVTPQPEAASAAPDGVPRREQVESITADLRELLDFMEANDRKLGQ